MTVKDIECWTPIHISKSGVVNAVVPLNPVNEGSVREGWYCKVCDDGRDCSFRFLAEDYNTALHVIEVIHDDYVISEERNGHYNR